MSTATEKDKITQIKQKESSLNCRLNTDSTDVPSSAPIASQTQVQPTATLQPAQPSVQQPINTAPAPAIQTVIVEGVGSTPQDAAQNAAENALKNVVGAFIDSNMNLEKKTLIYDGLKSETKNISKDIKEYSQGSIKSFELLDTQQQNGLFRVNAKVTVRNENFSAYIKQIAQGESSVDRSSLMITATKMENQKTFENISTEIENKKEENANAILRDNIVKPIISGEVLDIFVGKPMVISDAIKYLDFDKETKEILKKENQNKIIFEVNFKLKKEFIENLNVTLHGISFEQKSIDLNDYLLSDITMCWNIFCLEILDKKNSHIANLISIKSKKPDNFYGIKCEEYIDKDNSYFDTRHYRRGCYSDKSRLKIEVKDSENSILMIRNIEQEKFVKDYNLFVVTNNVSLIMKKLSRSSYKTPPWLLIKKSDDVSVGNNDKYIQKIFNEDGFYVLLDLDADMIKKMDKITVTLDK